MLRFAVTIRWTSPCFIRITQVCYQFTNAGGMEGLAGKDEISTKEGESVRATASHPLTGMNAVEIVTAKFEGDKRGRLLKYDLKTSVSPLYDIVCLISFPQRGRLVFGFSVELRRDLIKCFPRLRSCRVSQYLSHLSNCRALSFPQKGKLLIVKLNFDLKIFLKGSRGRFDTAASMEHILYQTN